MAFAYLCYAFAHEIEMTLGGAILYLQSDLSNFLPTGLAYRQIHPILYSSHLKAYIRHPEVEPPPLVLVDDELEYEIETILCHRGKGS